MGSFQSDQFPVLVCHMVALCLCPHSTGARDCLAFRDGLLLPLETITCVFQPSSKHHQQVNTELNSVSINFLSCFDLSFLFFGKLRSTIWPLVPIFLAPLGGANCHLQCLISIPWVEQAEALAGSFAGDSTGAAGADVKLGLFSRSRSREGSRERHRDGAISGTAQAESVWML